MYIVGMKFGGPIEGFRDVLSMPGDPVRKLPMVKTLVFFVG